MQKLSCLISLSLVFVLLNTGASTAQCSLEGSGLRALLEPSTLVVEAQVKSAASFWSPDGKMIYTRNELEVFQVFKGKLQGRVKVITPGGVVGDEAVKVTPAAELQVGDIGIFALKPAVFSLPRPFSAAMQSVSPRGAIVVYSPDYEKAYFSTGETRLRAEAYSKIIAETRMAPVRKKAFPELRLNRSFIPKIDSITPAFATAGTGDIVTIHGQGFGAVGGTVFFRDADRGGAGFVATLPWHIASWTPGAIAIRVPHKAGTGTPLVLTGSGTVAFSAYPVNVAYAYNNVMSSGAFHQPKLIDHKSREDGGYLFRLSSSNSHNGISVTSVEGAQDALNAAAGAWQDSVGFPVYIGYDCPLVGESINGSLNDGRNVISFDHDEWDIREQLGEQVLAATFSRYARCGDGEWELTDVDIVFRRGAMYNEDDHLNWSFDGTPGINEIDFQSVVLHELGHALQLQHIVNPDGVMHYAATFGDAPHGLSSEGDVTGGFYAMAESRNYVPPTVSCFPEEHFGQPRQFDKYSPGYTCIPEEDTDAVEALTTGHSGGPARFEVDVFPNPKPKGAPLQLSLHAGMQGEITLMLFSINGQRIARRQYQMVTGRQTLEWLLPDVPSGVYQLLVQHRNGRVPMKIVIP